MLTSDSSSPSHATAVNVKIPEGLLTVVAAFAVEQIAQGTLDALQQQNPTFKAARVFAAFALITLVVRFFHGNNIYLAREYSTWHHKDMPSGRLIATPLRYFRDLLFHLLQYLLLVLAGCYTVKDLSLRT